MRGQTLGSYDGQTEKDDAQEGFAVLEAANRAHHQGVG